MEATETRLLASQRRGIDKIGGDLAKDQHFFFLYKKLSPEKGQKSMWPSACEAKRDSARSGGKGETTGWRDTNCVREQTATPFPFSLPVRGPALASLCKSAAGATNRQVRGARPYAVCQQTRAETIKHTSATRITLAVISCAFSEKQRSAEAVRVPDEELDRRPDNTEYRRYWPV